MAKQKALPDRQTLETRIKNSRGNLLLVVAFTVINIILLVTESSTYFLFSAFIPYMLADLGMWYGGMYSPEVYGEYYPGAGYSDLPILTVFMVIAAIILLLYLVSWIFSKKNRIGWLIFALVFFALDTVGMLLSLELGLDNIIDIVFHAWVIISLAQGIHACAKLKKLPPEEAEILETEQLVEVEEC